MEGIKTRLEREKAGWVDELPNVLWAHRTSIKTSNRETREAVISAEIGMPTGRTMMITPNSSYPKASFSEKKVSSLDEPSPRAAFYRSPSRTTLYSVLIMKFQIYEKSQSLKGCINTMDHTTKLSLEIEVFC
ncbi:hypothetical protein Tco_1533628 [Tanacetum coccineum]